MDLFCRFSGRLLRQLAWGEPVPSIPGKVPVSTQPVPSRAWRKHPEAINSNQKKD